jgi:hypothetical protein
MSNRRFSERSHHVDAEAGHNSLVALTQLGPVMGVTTRRRLTVVGCRLRENLRLARVLGCHPGQAVTALEFARDRDVLVQTSDPFHNVQQVAGRAHGIAPGSTVSVDKHKCAAAGGIGAEADR